MTGIHAILGKPETYTPTNLSACTRQELAEIAVDLGWNPDDVYAPKRPWQSYRRVRGGSSRRDLLDVIGIQLQVREVAQGVAGDVNAVRMEIEGSLDKLVKFVDDDTQGGVR